MPSIPPVGARTTLVLLAFLTCAAFSPPGTAALGGGPIPLCPSDCDGSGAVTVDELVVAVGIAAGSRPLDECPTADASDDGVVATADLLRAVEEALRDCAGSWVEVREVADAGWMMSAWGPGDGTVWAVGGPVDRGRIFRRQTGGWSEVDHGLDVPLLNWVHGTSSADVFAGGLDGVILHFDGEAWRRQETPVSASVWGLWAVAPDDVWAVGGDVSSEQPPFALRYDGATWSGASLPPLERPHVEALFKVWASGPDDVWMVGHRGVILHYDGAAVTEFGIGVSQDLIGIWGTGPNDIMIVGGRGIAEMAHFDGQRWRRPPPIPLPGLSGVWMRRPDVAHAVGVNGTVVRIDPRTFAVTRDAAPTMLDLHGVFGDADGTLIALGLNGITPERGVTLTRRLSDEE